MQIHSGYYNVTGLTTGNYTYRVYANDKAGNQGGTEERTITVNITVAGELPFVNFSYSPETPEEGDTVSFKDESYDPDGTIVGWLWDFGDGTNSTDPNPTHVYDTAKTYTVRLTVTDNDGDSNSTSKEITVKEKPSGGGDQGNEGTTGRGGGGGGGGGALPLPTGTAAPTPTATKLRTPVSIPWIPPKKTPKSSAPSIPGTPSETKTPKPTPKTPKPFEGPKGLLPGFEAIFAIGGLLAVAYLIRRGEK